MEISKKLGIQSPANLTGKKDAFLVLAALTRKMHSFKCCGSRTEIDVLINCIDNYSNVEH